MTTKNAKTTAFTQALLDLTGAAYRGAVMTRELFDLEVNALRANSKLNRRTKRWVLSELGVEAYKVGVLIQLLGLPMDDTGILAVRMMLTRGTKRTPEQTKAINAAAARLSRRLKDADIDSPDARGTIRHTQKPGKPAPDAPALDSDGEPENFGDTGPSDAAARKPVAVPLAALAVPILINPDEWTAMFDGLAAFLTATERKNAKRNRHVRATCDAIRAAIKAHVRPE